MRLAAGLRRDPPGSYSAAPDPLAVIRGGEIMDGRGRKGFAIGRYGRGRQGREMGWRARLGYLSRDLLVTLH